MSRKKKTPKEALDILRQKANDTVARWTEIRAHGCSDPGWADGINLNLLRNHLYSYKRQMREICEENKLDYPPEMYLPALPYTDANYFADPKSERAQRIMSRPGWRCHNHEQLDSECDRSQLDLF